MKTRTTLLLPIAIIYLITSCYKEEDYSGDKIDTSDVIKDFRFTRDGKVPADGQSIIRIIVDIPFRTNDDLALVKFTSTKGTFSNDEKEQTIEAKKFSDSETEGKRTALAFLKSDQEPGIASIEVSVGKTAVRTKGIQFTPSLPEKLEIIPENLALSSSITNELEVTVRLSKQFGKVSIKQKVELLALKDPDNLNSRLGTFRVKNDESNAEELTTFIWAQAPDSTFTGLYISWLLPKGQTPEFPILSP